MASAPNILWIVTTQWRAQACGYAGDPNARTPNLDRLAVTGANFRQAVTPHPFGPFARAALLTGTPSPQNGVSDYYDPLPAGARTIARDLTDLGYATAFLGKWHLAPREPTAPLVGELHARMVVAPEYRGGFQFWEGFESGFLLNDPWLHGTRLPEPRQFRGYQSDVVCEHAADWIASAGPASRPWFCVVSLEPPHPPYAEPAGDAEVMAGITLLPNVPLRSDIVDKARTELAGYYRHIAATDAAIGRLMARVDLAGTAIIVTSVHGDMHGAHGLFRKGWPYEESIRVPLLVSLPAGLRWGAQGSRDDLVSLVDLPAWARAWAAGQAADSTPAAVQKISMPSVVRLPYQCDRVWRGIRTRTRKLIVADTAQQENLRWLFFDLETDPYETANLIADPARQAEIESLMGAVF